MAENFERLFLCLGFVHSLIVGAAIGSKIHIGLSGIDADEPALAAEIQ